MGFRDLDRDRDRRARAVELHEPPQGAAGAGLGGLDQRVADEHAGRFDQADAAGEAAVVPPVGVQRGQRLGAAGVVDLDDD